MQGGLYGKPPSKKKGLRTLLNKITLRAFSTLAMALSQHTFDLFIEDSFLFIGALGGTHTHTHLCMHRAQKTV